MNTIIRIREKFSFTAHPSFDAILARRRIAC
jgi:hypothetical protein